MENKCRYKYLTENNDKWTELLKIPIRERIDNEEYQAFSKD